MQYPENKYPNLSSCPLTCSERLIEIRDDVVDAFRTDRQPYHSRRRTSGCEFLAFQLGVRRAGRVNDERLRIADIGQMREQLHRVDQFLARFDAALHFERQDGADSLRQIFLSELVGRMAFKPGIIDAFYR